MRKVHVAPGVVDAADPMDLATPSPRRRAQRFARTITRRVARRLRGPANWLGSHVYLPIWDRLRGEEGLEGVDDIHLVNPLRTLHGGGPLRTVALFLELKGRASVKVWSQARPTAEVMDLVPVQPIRTLRGQFPRRGTIVIVGSYFTVGSWVHYAHPRRIILVHNNNLTRADFDRLIASLSNKAGAEVEIVYASEFARQTIGVPGHIEPSLIDIDRFVPASPSPDPGTTRFTVGRLSRPDSKKHHPHDAELYRRLIAADCEIRIMGPSPELEAAVGGAPGVTLIPAWGERPELFLQQLDCFFYRTAEEWPEPWGRVVLEAMACGLPVVCEKRGGYVDVIDHGENGFLFQSQQEAFEILMRLQADPALRADIGAAARRTAESAFSSARRRALMDFYLR